jgi:YegS/Rv2252/BmrU family lipid kinase
MSENKIFFIINAKSGVGYHRAVEGRIIQESARWGYECELQFTQQRGHATELAREALARGYTRIVAVGGDGTVNETARALVGTNAALGILPKGSGNGLARHLGIATDFKAALRQLFDSQTIAIDSMTVNGELSLNVSGIGFDGHVAAAFGKNGRRGLWNYVRIVIQEFVRFQRFSFTMQPTHPAEPQSVYMLSFANSSQFGNDARIAPEASIRDGWIDVVAIPTLTIWHAIRLLGQSWLRKHDSSLAPVLRIREGSIDLQTPMAYHLDGEPQPPAKHFAVRILPTSLRVLIPARKKHI